MHSVLGTEALPTNSIVREYQAVPTASTILRQTPPTPYSEWTLS